jgi:hypothetical protein
MKYVLCFSLMFFACKGTAHAQILRPDAFISGSSITAADTAGTNEKAREVDPYAMKQNLRMISRQEVPGAKQWERKKSPRVAMFSSMLLPGLGQLYNGRRIKTMLMVGVAGFYMSNIWLEHKNAQRRKQIRDSLPVNSADWREENLWYDFHKEQTRDYAWWSGAVWIIGVLDAYIDAHLYDVRAYRPSRQGSSERTGYLTVNFSF